MSVITQNHILNIVPGMSAPVVVHVSQGDSGVELEFVLVNGSEIFDPTGTVISVHGIRQDGTGWGPVACAREDGKIKFTLPDAATAVKGSGMAELSISNGEETVGTTNFAILVETATFPQGVTYANDVSVYEAILAYVNQMGEQTVANVEADLAAEIANRQAADAVLQQNINSEASTRAGADTTLQTNLNNAVSSLNEALTDEVSARELAISNEASARASADTTINARIDNIIAPSGEAPSAAEVTDARVGADGKTYSSLGNAIRSQINDLSQVTDNVWDGEYYGGYYLNNNGVISSTSLAVFTSGKISIDASTEYIVVNSYGGTAYYVHIGQYAADDTFLGFFGYINNGIIKTASNAAYLRFTSNYGNTYDPSVNGIRIAKSSSPYGDVFIPQRTALDQKASVDIAELYKHTEITDNLWDEKYWYSNRYIGNNGNYAIPSAPCFASGKIAVSPSTTYYLVNSNGTNNCRVAQYKSDGTFISFLGYIVVGSFTTDANAAYIAFTSNMGDDYDPSVNGIAIYPISSTHREYLPHMVIKDDIARIPKTIEDDYIIIGVGCTYTKINEGFAAALTQNKGVILRPGVYDLANESYRPTAGYVAPKHLIGYGAKIVYDSPTENWDFSPINMSNSMEEVIIEGLEIECSNCRYCIHDEEYNNPNDYYHHVIKNCVLTHKSVASETLIAPQCIGGGFGNGGFIEVENCICNSKYTHDVSYHAASNQTKGCTWICKDSVFNHTAQLIPNAVTGFVNKMYYSNCKCGVLPTIPEQENSELIYWNLQVDE